MLGKAKLFTTLDLRSGYRHIALDDDAIKKTAFILPFGKFDYLKVPFGLAQAPAYFQNLMNKVLNGLSFAIAYLDDIIIFSETPEHISNSQFYIISPNDNQGAEDEQSTIYHNIFINIIIVYNNN